MSDALKPQPSTPVDVNEGDVSDANIPDRDLTPAEIDARHARHLLERALAQLERGERGPAELACRQAIHLAPGASHAHSLAGLLALLNQDVPGARASYEKAVSDFSKASPERERLIALRMAQADQSPVDASSLVPDLGTEILRLRQAVHAASTRDFLPMASAGVPGAAVAPSTTESITAAPPQIAAPPSPALLTPEARPAFASRLERRRRASAWAVVAAAVSAAVVSFFVMRSFTRPQPVPAPAPVATTAPAGTRISPEPTPTPVAGTPEPAAANAATGGSGSTPGVAAPQPTPTPTPSATVNVRPLPPVRAVPGARPTPRPAPRSAPRTTPREGGASSNLPAPAASPRPTARPTPRPEPVFPAMPPPRVTLPSAGGESPEFPRVLPDND